MRQNAYRTRDWSKLCPDVLRKIIETLNPLASHRAKTVCSDWYSVWKTCVHPPSYSLQIIHQGDSPPRLSNPEEDTRKLVGDSSRRYCMASYENWLLMVDSHLDFHIFNLLTCERISLPSMTLPIKGEPGVSFERGGGMGCSDQCGYFVDSNGKKVVPKDVLKWKKNSAVLWINETTGDYFVAWTFRDDYLFSYKKGYASWSHLGIICYGLGFVDMAYKNNKLYVLTTNHMDVIPFPGEGIGRYMPYWFRINEQSWENVLQQKIAIQESGDVLLISKEEERNGKIMFKIFKMNVEGEKTWERIESIGDDEMLIFGHGVTVRAPVKDYVGDGVKSGSICFIDDDVWPDDDHDHLGSDCGVFDIATSEIKWYKKPCFYINESQWFVPWFA